MEGEQQSDPSSRQLEKPDYADSLEPGYRFCPTDSELIVHYIKRKIETGKHPKCRLYEINLYDHDPQELSERYRPHENKWYFLTSRERKYPRGTLPSRITKNFGFWRTTQKYTTVYNDAREAVGSRRSLAYYDNEGNKTLWLMVEYTTNDPNLPIGSDDKKLSDCVLCKVYKNEKSLPGNNKPSRQIPNKRSQQQNQLDDQPPTKRQRVSVGNQPNGPECIHNSRTDVQIVTPQMFMHTMYQQPVVNIDGFGQPLPQTLQGNPGGLMQTRINPNLRGSSSAVEAHVQVCAREQVGPYSDNNNGDTMGRVPDPPTSTNGLHEGPTVGTCANNKPHEDPTLVTWTNNIDKEQPPSTLRNGSHEDPTLVTCTNKISEELSQLSLTKGPDEDPTLLALLEDPLLLTWPDSSIEDRTSKANSAFYSLEDIESFLMSSFDI